MANRDDGELRELFGAFDHVRASDELKSATLSAILASAQAAPAESARTQPDAGHNESASAESPSASSARAPKQARKAKWRAIRVAALAACLALALTGGVAWAVPASHVQVTQDGTTIDLGVNCFGIAVSAESDDEDGRDVIEREGLRNVPQDEAVTRAADALEKKHPDRPVEVDGTPRDHEPEPEPDTDAQASPVGLAPADSASSTPAALPANAPPDPAGSQGDADHQGSGGEPEGDRADERPDDQMQPPDTEGAQQPSEPPEANESPDGQAAGQPPSGGEPGGGQEEPQAPDRR